LKYKTFDNQWSILLRKSIVNFYSFAQLAVPEKFIIHYSLFIIHNFLQGTSRLLNYKYFHVK